MTLKNYLTAMSAATGTAWVAFIYILFIVDPEATNWPGFLLFYVTLFISLVGTSAIIGFVVRFKALKRELVWNSVIEAFRQSFLFAALITASLILLSLDLFTWFNILLMVLALSLLEYFLLSLSKS